MVHLKCYPSTNDNDHKTKQKQFVDILRPSGIHSCVLICSASFCRDPHPRKRHHPLGHQVPEHHAWNLIIVKTVMTVIVVIIVIIVIIATK